MGFNFLKLGSEFGIQKANTVAMKKEVLILIAIFLVQLAFAQDAHFSQSALQTSFANPGKVGMQSTDFKLAASYRSQWAAIPSAYKTYSVAFEQKVNAFSWGADIVSNNAGDASIKKNNFRLKASYQKTLSKKGNALRAGVAVGMIQQSFDPQAFQFDNQYEAGVGYNAELGSRETFDLNRQVLPDVSAGLVWLNALGKINNEIGLAFSHLNQPAASFYTNGKEVYPIRTLFHIQSQIPVKNNLSLNGQFQYSKQATAKELIIGAGVSYDLGNHKKWNIDIASRKGDAYIFSTGIEFKQGIVALSYDMHTSKLSGTTNGNGAIEISATYFFNKGKASTDPDTNVMELTKEDAAKDNDNDGVPNGVDECPNIPGLWKYNGCNDKDEDGIYDSKDACPNLYGEKENKGCPMESIIDSDQDGLVDSVDECPFLKGLPEHNGCPDTDKDGVSDKTDLCPFLKGSKDNNGCPGTKGLNDPLNTDSYLPNVHVEFDTDKADIKMAYKSKLDEIAQFLIQQEALSVYVSGHTDAEGDAAYNYELGQRRCFAVMNYLIDQGVNGSRISIISYGETKPIHTNNNVYGKAKNRRAEVILVE